MWKLFTKILFKSPEVPTFLMIFILFVSKFQVGGIKYFKFLFPVLPQVPETSQAVKFQI